MLTKVLCGEHVHVKNQQAHLSPTRAETWVCADSQSNSNFQKVGTRDPATSGVWVRLSYSPVDSEIPDPSHQLPLLVTFQDFPHLRGVQFLRIFQRPP